MELMDRNYFKKTLFKKKSFFKILTNVVEINGELIDTFVQLFDFCLDKNLLFEMKKFLKLTN
jgi:hypothetical protein